MTAATRHTDGVDIDHFPMPLWATQTEPGQRYGAPRTGGRIHAGDDFGTPDHTRHPLPGSLWWAPFDGRFVPSEQKVGAGLIADVQAADGRLIRNFHCARFLRGAGAVLAGEPVAVVGATGGNYPVHYHVETWPRGLSGGHTHPMPILEAARTRCLARTCRTGCPHRTDEGDDDDMPSAEEVADAVMRRMLPQPDNRVPTGNQLLDAQGLRALHFVSGWARMQGTDTGGRRDLTSMQAELAWGIVAATVQVLEQVGQIRAGEVDVDAVAAKGAARLGVRLELKD